MDSLTKVPAVSENDTLLVAQQGQGQPAEEEVDDDWTWDQCGTFTCGKWFGLKCARADLFVTSEWHINQRVYLVYSVVWMLYIPTWLILEGVINFHIKFHSEPWRQATFFIYLTNWTYILLSMVAILRGVTVCWYHHKLNGVDGRNRTDELAPQEGLPIVFKIIWVLYNIVLPSQVIVGVAYYLHAAILGAMDRTTPLSNPMNIHIHGVGTIYILLDLWISAIPLKPGHVIHVLFYGTAYAAFSGIYFVCGGTNKSGHPGIYRLLDWSQRKAILYVALAIGAATPAVWCTLYGFYRLKRLIHCKWTNRNYSPAAQLQKNLDINQTTDAGNC